MIPLADIGGLFVVAVIAGIAYVVKSIMAAATNPPPKRAPGPRTSVQMDNSDEERTRRFLEALGLPTAAGEMKPPRTPPPLRPPAERHNPRAEKPVPPIVPPSTFGPGERRPKREKWRAQQQHSRPAEPPPMPPPLYQLPAPVEQTRSWEVSVRPIEEFQTVSSQVTAIPYEGRSMPQANASGRQTATAAQLARKLLRSPDSLRSAILLREILGPPRGLQSPW